MADNSFQLFLEVHPDDGVMVVGRPVSERSHPANLSILTGAVVEVPDGKSLGDNDIRWKMVQKVVDLVDPATRLAARIRGDEFVEDLTYAYKIVMDILGDYEGDFMMSKESAETLLRGLRERIVSIVKRAGLDIGRCRSEGD